MEQRLDKWIASCTMFSRKEVKEGIRAGLVRGENKIYHKPEEKIPEGSLIYFKNRQILLEQFVYIMMNKPSGVISASRDSKAKTVVDLVPDEWKRPDLFPAGRLDKDTVGFVLLTNDGGFSHQILSPAHRHPKVYHARLDAQADTPTMVEEFARGMNLGEGNISSPAELILLEEGAHPLYQVVIYEGFYHQIKRMFGVFGRQVIWLKRVQIGGLSLDADLKEGESKKLSVEEKNLILKTI